MNLLIFILNHFPGGAIYFPPLNLQHISLAYVFGVPLVFILKFFGELFLVFSISALISHILRIDKTLRD
jgi:hypothetical protein